MVVNFDRQAYNAGLLLPTKAEKMKQGYQIGPPWLRPLLTAQFFNTCDVHGDSNRNECNLYCLDCRGDALCSGCTPQHRDHHVVQIRRSSYHDVVRVSELQKVLDLTGVQTYIINSARVVFLNARPQPRHAKGVTKTCEICDRSLLDTFRYCSLGCKLTGIRRHNDMTFHLQPKNKQEQQEQGNQNPDEQQQQQQQQVEEEKSSNMAENPLAPPLPARSSITSEDTGSSGGVSGHSKRTRSSRIKSSPPHNSGADSGYLFRSSIADDLAAAHSTKPMNHHKPQQQHTTQNQQEQKQPQNHEEQNPLHDQDMSLRTTLIQRSLGTLKLGRPSQQQQSSCVSMETESDQIVHHPGSPAAVSSSSIAGLSELSPPTPPPTRTAKRRKGTPHRAPLGM